MPRLPSVGGDPRAILAGAVAVLAVLGVGFAIWSGGQRRATLETEISAAISDSTRFATTIDLIQSLRARQDTIRQKIGVIEEVDQRRYVWPHILDEVSAAVPAYTWLTQISSSEARDTTDSALAFTLQGNAASTLALTRLMKNLEGSPFIRSVTLVTSEQTTDGGHATHRFTLEARYERPDSAAIQTVPIIAVD